NPVTGGAEIGFSKAGRCAEGQNRTGDTTIFSRVLYQLSYLGTRRYSSRPSPRVTIAARKGPYHALRLQRPLRAARRRPAAGWNPPASGISRSRLMVTNRAMRL